MSLGNTKSQGNKGGNMPWQFRMLKVLSSISVSSGGGATEATLQSVLAALQDGQDFEQKLVRDSNGDVFLQVRIWNPDTQSFDPPIYYDADGNVAVIGVDIFPPLTFIDPQATFDQMLLELQTLAGAVVGNEMQVDVVTSALPVGAATEATLALLLTEATFNSLIETLGATDVQRSAIYDSSGNIIDTFGGLSLPDAAIIVGVEKGSYAFNAAAKTVTFSGLGTLKREQILKITNIHDQVVIYDPENSNTGGTLVGNVLTLEHDTTLMSNTDDLQIYLKFDNSEDYNLGHKRVQEQSPDREHRTESLNPDYSGELAAASGPDTLTEYMVIDKDTFPFGSIQVFGLTGGHADDTIKVNLYSSNKPDVNLNPATVNPRGNYFADKVVAITDFQNNGSGIVRATLASNPYTTGEYITISGSSTGYNGSYRVVYVDATHIDLQGTAVGATGADACTATSTGDAYSLITDLVMGAEYEISGASTEDNDIFYIDTKYIDETLLVEIEYLKNDNVGDSKCDVFVKTGY